ncbi:hypothetical protein E3N88_30098 [Mikania micrantha]|uniref:Uncharacterized protein n=1 Tax=Mikania micrantha TaxID=192012 RepID=A0A5N6MKM3_9ASTR|nr:hypothetical protein E3N88_30098 [Mikania micrantha]
MIESSGPLDLILGMEWLKSLGVVVHDWKNLWMKFIHKETPVTLQGIDLGQPFTTALHNWLTVEDHPKLAPISLDISEALHTQATRMTVPVKQDKVWFAESKGQKKVHFASVKPDAKVVQAERSRRFKPVRGFGNSGSTFCVSGTVSKQQWVLKTRISTAKISPLDYLLNLESDNIPRCISGSGGMCKPVETEDESVMVTVTTVSVMTDALKLSQASTLGRLCLTKITGVTGRLDYCCAWMAVLILSQGLRVGDC